MNKLTVKALKAQLANLPDDHEVIIDVGGVCRYAGPSLYRVKYDRVEQEAFDLKDLPAYFDDPSDHMHMPECVLLCTV